MKNTYSNQVVKESSIKIDKERFRVSELSFSVKSDRSAPASMDMQLPVHIFHTKSNQSKELFFCFAGGPGISNMSFKPPKRLLENHNVVLVGYRGVDGSVKLRSKEIKKAVKGINNSLLSDESIKNLQNATSEYIYSLKEKNIDLNNFTIIDVIGDKYMPKKWTVFTLDPEKIKATSFVLLYLKQSAVMVFDSYRKAVAEGDYSGLYLMQLAYDYLLPKMFTWGDLLNKGASADIDKSKNYAELLEPDSQKIGAPLSNLIWCGGLLWDNVLIDD